MTGPGKKRESVIRKILLRSRLVDQAFSDAAMSTTAPRNPRDRMNSLITEAKIKIAEIYTRRTGTHPYRILLEFVEALEKGMKSATKKSHFEAMKEKFTEEGDQIEAAFVDFVERTMRESLNKG